MRGKSSSHYEHWTFYSHSKGSRLPFCVFDQVVFMGNLSLGTTMFYSAILLLFAAVSTIRAYSASDMATHLTDSFANYYTYVRPVTDQTHAVSVTMSLYLIGINSFDNQEQKLTTTAYMELAWNDEILARDWSNAAITSILVPQTSAWVPDLALQNGFKSLSGLGSKFLFVDVDYTSATQATVSWKPYEVFESACTVDITFFPFDTTTCDLKFVIWSNTKDLVTVTKGTATSINMELYEESSEWTIVSTSASDFTTTTSSGVTFSITMKRKPLFYFLNIILPVILLAGLNFGLFLLPASAGEKVGYCVTTFLAFSVFLLIVTAELPKNSEKVSVIGLYLALMTFSSTLIVGFTVFQLRLAHRGDDHPIPECLKRLTRGVQRLVYGGCCCVGTGHVQPYGSKADRLLLAEDVCWAGVSDALDFLFFFVWLSFTALLTSICVGIAAAGPSV